MPCRKSLRIAPKLCFTSGMNQVQSSTLWPGVPLALLSAILFGVSAPLSKLLLGVIEPQLLAGLLYLGAGIGLAIVHARGLVGLASEEAPLRRGDIPWLMLVIAFGGVLGPLLLLLGLSRTDAATGSLLLNLEGLATMAIAWVCFLENVDRRLLIGAMAILCGAAVLSWQGTSIAVNTGALLIVAACVCWGIDNNLTRKLSAPDPVVIAMTKGFVAGLFNCVVAWGRDVPMPPATLVASAGVLGFVSIGVSLVLFVLALRHLGTARTGAYFSLAPFIGAVVALGLGEPLTIALATAGALMGVGLWLHLSERHEHEHVHEAMAHEHRHVHDEHHQHSHDGRVTEPHSHWHEHVPLRHKHPHYPDLHHRHSHSHSQG
jgi:drug/metabolite transporter (DMT)-like permease